MGERPTKKPLHLKRRKWGPNGCPCGYLVNPRRSMREADLGGDRPKYLATTEFEPSHPIRACSAKGIFYTSAAEILTGG